MTAEGVQTVVAILALLAAVWAAVLSWKAYQTSYRPMLRVVPLSEGDDSGGITLLPDRLVLKNIGRGPAISIVVLQGRGSDPGDLLAEVDALEPLGETFGPEFRESARVGRREVLLDAELSEGSDYRVLCIDIAGRWHETTFKVLPYGRFESRLAMRRRAEEVPRWVRDRSQIVSDDAS